MAASKVTIKAEPRKESGKGVARRLRRQGRVPCVLYGHDVETRSLTADLAEIERAAGQHGLISLKVKGVAAERHVMVREVQHDFLKNAVLHVDFQEVRLDEKITASVPVVALGDPIGVHHGGILEQVLHEIELESLPADMPDRLELNVADMDVGDSVAIPQLPMPERVVPLLSDPNAIVLHVVMPRLQAVEEEVAEEEEAAEAEPVEGEDAGAETGQAEQAE